MRKIKFIFSFIVIVFIFISCEKANDTDSTNPAVKPDLNTYISYDIEGTKVMYSDTMAYILLKLINFDFASGNGEVLPQTSYSRQIPGIIPRLNKFYPYPRFGLTLTLSNFSLLREGDIRNTDSFNMLVDPMYSRTTVSIFKRATPDVFTNSGIDTTAIIYEAGILTNLLSENKLGDWKSSKGNGKIKITKIENIQAYGSVVNYKFITGEITGNFRKYRQGLINGRIKNYFMGDVPVMVKFRLMVM